MSRWTGYAEVVPVLEAGDAWRDRCFLGNTSIFTDHALWTLGNLHELANRTGGAPALGKSDFLDKLEQQLSGSPPEVIQLAAEVLWFLHLFPNTQTLAPETKRNQILRVWGWSGAPAPETPFLDDAHLDGVGHPGTGYFTHRPSEYLYLTQVALAFKALPPTEQARLFQEDVPWTFMQWLDERGGSDRRIVRGAILYFLFPDYLERSMSKDHRRQIYESLKIKLDPNDVIKSRTPTLGDYDRAIAKIRAALEAERGSTEIDFYDDATKPLWFTTLREGSVKAVMSWLNGYLVNRGLQLNQCGRDIKRLDDKREIDPKTGFWANITFVTSKPPRWLIHFDVTGDEVVAKIPDHHRAGVIGFANTKGGNSGALAVRILPVFKLGEEQYRALERWEWLLLLCFPGGLAPGSSGEAFDDFDTKTGVLRYMKREQPYIFAGLLCLNSGEEQFAVEGDTAKAITYRSATDALQKLINIAPVGGSDE